MFLYSTEYINSLESIQPSIQWVQRDLVPGVKQSYREAHHLPPSSAEVKIGGDNPPPPNMSSWRGALLIKNGHTFTCILE
jgi:hypothetical protein